MKFLLDVHISYKIAKFLIAQGHEAVHLNFVLDKSSTKDDKISEYADRNDYVLISKDSDFKDSFFLNNTPKKLIKISLGNVSNKELQDLLKNNLNLITKVFDKSCYLELNKGGFAVIIEK
ncbi:MAG: hypothetical protein FVQ77_14765 [Cytophagales bacterium]|nr:hypothetical protein [Cytophagales bacterium]